MIRAALLLALWLPLMAHAETVPEPEDFRQDEYRAPVPATLEGVTVVDTDAAFALWKTGRGAFIDVLPRPPKPDNLPAGTVWHDKIRNSIPGAIWLPNVGYGRIAEPTEAYFRGGLDKAAGNDPAAPLLFFCLNECWMSWNAAKRAREWGYERVFWFPQGTDGWTGAEHPTVELEPEPGF